MFENGFEMLVYVSLIIVFANLYMYDGCQNSSINREVWFIK